MSKTVYFGQVKNPEVISGDFPLFIKNGKCYDFKAYIEFDDVVIEDSINRFVPLSRKDVKPLIKALKKLT